MKILRNGVTKVPQDMKRSKNMENDKLRFEQCFIQYQSGKGTSKKEDREKVALFLIITGSQALEVFINFQ